MTTIKAPDLKIQNKYGNWHVSKANVVGKKIKTLGKKISIYMLPRGVMIHVFVWNCSA